MLDLSIPWWGLIALGALLVVVEIFSMAFIVMWFGIGAMLTGLLTLFVPDMDLGLQLLLAGLMGGVLMYLLRDRFVSKGNAEMETLHTFSAGKGTLVVTKEGNVTVHCNGTYWRIGNLEELAGYELETGLAVQVSRFENNAAYIDPQSVRLRTAAIPSGQ